MTNPTNATPSEYWEPTKAHSDTFRNWLIAYGIAIPYLAVSQKDFAELSQQVGCIKWIIGFFFVGALSQVLQVAVAKYTMMILYSGEAITDFKDRWIYKKADKFSEHFWPYVATDVITVASYITATWLLFSSLYFTPTNIKQPASTQTPSTVQPAAAVKHTGIPVLNSSGTSQPTK